MGDGLLFDVYGREEKKALEKFLGLVFDVLL